MAALTLASLVEGFFLEWLSRDRKVSPNTTAACRDSFRLFFTWLASARDVDPTDAAVEASCGKCGRVLPKVPDLDDHISELPLEPLEVLELGHFAIGHHKVAFLPRA